MSSENINGSTVLAEAVREMRVDLAALVARCSIWAHPETVHALQKAEKNAVWFPATRRKKLGERRGSKIDGCKIDDNTAANLAIKLAVFGERVIKGFHTCHVWQGSCYDARYHTSICNLVLVPAPLAGLTDYDKIVATSLKRRSYELYGWYPEGEATPVAPTGYPEESSWRPFQARPPRAVAALARRLQCTL